MELARDLGAWRVPYPQSTNLRCLCISSSIGQLRFGQYTGDVNQETNVQTPNTTSQRRT
jgi:hypothetical protein